MQTLFQSVGAVGTPALWENVQATPADALILKLGRLPAAAAIADCSVPALLVAAPDDFQAIPDGALWCAECILAPWTAFDFLLRVGRILRSRSVGQNSSPAANDVKPNILIADDDPEIRALLKALLGAEFACRFVRSGLAALELVRQEAFDLVLLDLNMPSMNGLQVLRAIRTDAGLRHTPVVFLTAEGDPKQIQTARTFGANDYIVKPFTAATLVQRIRGVLPENGLKAKPV